MGRSNPAGIAPGRLVAGIGAVVFADALTKFVAVDRLLLPSVPHPVLGDVVRFTLAYNRGAAFGLHLGAWSRPAFIALSFVMLAVLWGLYRTTTVEPSVAARARVLALASVAAGAIGNLIDRVRSARGVVDFIDIGIGGWRWPTFNLADIAVSCGAMALAVVLWREDHADARR